MHLFRNRNLLLLAVLFAIAGCQPIDLYERNVSVPGHAWKGSFRPSFTFNISDTTATYRLYAVFRHTNAYNYNNLWVNVYVQYPDSTMKRFPQLELPLATNEKGWMGSALGDLYEHRIALTPPSQPLVLNRSGKYTFTLEQIMREDPLRHVFNVGLRLEKVAR